MAWHQLQVRLYKLALSNFRENHFIQCHDFPSTHQRYIRVLSLGHSLNFHRLKSQILMNCNSGILKRHRGQPWPSLPIWVCLSWHLWAHTLLEHLSEFILTQKCLRKWFLRVRSDYWLLCVRSDWAEVINMSVSVMPSMDQLLITNFSGWIITE